MRKLLLAGAMLAAMAMPASAAAGPHAPTGEWADFDNCPLSKPTVKLCLYSESTAGFVTTGSKTVPIKNPVILQGGLEFPLDITENVTFVAAEDGNTLVKAPQPVPGGLLGVQAPSWWPSFLRNWFNETINNGFTGVSATVELAKPASAIKVNFLSLFIGEGTTMSLPVKIKLSNPFLGSNCYIGSSTQPITFNLTVNKTSPPPPNQPIEGSIGEGSQNENETLLTINNPRLVDNAFAVPGANGCGGIFSFLIDPFVDSIVGIPSPAGTNTAVLEGGRILTGDANEVRASE